MTRHCVPIFLPFRPAAALILESALAKIDEAQRMAGQLNQDANALAADASKAINDVLDTPAETFTQ